MESGRFTSIKGINLVKRQVHLTPEKEEIIHDIIPAKGS